MTEPSKICNNCGGEKVSVFARVCHLCGAEDVPAITTEPSSEVTEASTSSIPPSVLGAGTNPPLRSGAYPSPFPEERIDRARGLSNAGTAIDLEVVGTGRRIASALIDFVPLTGLYLAMAALLGDFELGGRTSTPVGESWSAISANLEGWAFMHFWGLSLVYYFVSELLTGTTPGKWILGLRVEKLNGQPYCWQPVFIRTLLRVIDVLPAFYLIGIITIAVSGKNQRLGDMLSGTRVVRAYPANAGSEPTNVREDGASEFPSVATKKPSLAPRMAFAIIVVGLISGVSIMLAPGTANTSESMLEEELRSQSYSPANPEVSVFLQEAIPNIFESFSIEKFMEYSLPQFVEIKDQVEATLDYSNQLLGPVGSVHLTDVNLVMVELVTGEEVVAAVYELEGDFEKGPGTIELTVTKFDDELKIVAWRIASRPQ